MHRRLDPVLLFGCCALGASGALWEGVAHAANCASLPNTEAVLVSRLESQLGPAPVNDIGPLGETLVAELRGQLCADYAVSQALPNTCTASYGSVSTLRAALVADVLVAPKAALSQQLSSLSAEQRVAVGFLASLTGGVEPAEVSHRVAVALGYVANEQCAPPVVSGSDPVGSAVALVWALSQNTQTSLLRGQEPTEALIAQTLTTLRGGAPLTAVEVEMARAVAKQSLSTFAWYRTYAANPSDQQALTQLLLAEFTLYQQALTLTHGYAVTLPLEAWGVVSAVLNANVDGALEQLNQWLVARAQLQSGVVEAGQTALRFLRASTSEEAERIVRGQVLGLGPWSEKVLFSASGGVPQLQSDNFNVVGEGMLGYNDDAWGVIGGGGVSVLEFESDEYVASIAKFFGNGDTWFSLQLGERTKLDFRANFDFTLFDSETIVIGDEIVFAEETNLMLRGNGLLGLRHQGSNFGIGAWAGGGAQFEFYDPLVSNDAGVQIEETTSRSGMAVARARLQWGFLEDVLALRMSADWKLYSLTRVSETIDSTADEILVQSDESATQLEAIARGFLDVEAARFFDFVPGAGVGVDHYELAVEGQETQVVTIPVYMVGVRRTAF